MTLTRAELIKQKKDLERKISLKENLPHLFKLKYYKWQNDYLASKNRMKLICAGNQVGKSSVQIIHAIDLATDKKKWSRKAGFFPRRDPQMFWYIYPTKSKIQEEFNEKWVREFLPRGEMKEHPIYGWNKFNIEGDFAGIKFNSGVTIYFKAWGQDLQAGTCDAIFADEELPEKIYPELSMRLTANDAMFSMVFTATLNQPFWYDAIERRGQKHERFKHADKWQVSMEYDCRVFADGTPSHFTQEEINKRKNAIGDDTEIQRRVHGRFVTSEGRKIKSFNKSRNVKPAGKIHVGWEFYAGVDIGTGGEGHPAAISVVMVKPDYTYGRLVRFWRGNKHENTDTSQILNKYIELTSGLPPMTASYYDWHSKEFYLRATAAGIPFTKAEKSHEIGYDLLNVLFKNQMLDLDEQEGIDDLIQEMETLSEKTNKKYAEDDGIDSLRYAISSILWDTTNITTKLIEFVEEKEKPIIGLDEERRLNAEKQMMPVDRNEIPSVEEEIDFFNSLMD